MSKSRQQGKWGKIGQDQIDTKKQNIIHSNN